MTDSARAIRATGVSPLTEIPQRIADVEDAIADLGEALGRGRSQLDRLDVKLAARTQVKKLKKVLDQLDVIEVGREDAPGNAGDEV